MKLAIVALAASGCFTLPERHPLDRTGDGGPGGDGVDANEGPGPHANLIFVTARVFTLPSTTDGTANVNAADAACQGAAFNAPTTSPVRGHNFKAWISADPKNAIDRLSVTGARAWKRMDGLPIAATLTDLTSGTLLDAIAFDETGEPVASLVHALTGTTSSGSYDAGADAGCSQGRIEVGNPTATDTHWTEGDYVLCGDTSSHLYCVGYDIQDGQL